ncbi:cyclin-domain-containing protein [Myriangium duriaei CBS 260.36]|uniref:Cyclin-domain-containing protein n=1 Tax=Myriangium duriaei CBS 260.36 TaxID=1168546 RepID=A0A9P4MGC9_9PEZI|nr:cyclin-domain-containing protein [Myriangium duriaei CBS 260.36]
MVDTQPHTEPPSEANPACPPKAPNPCSDGMLEAKEKENLGDKSDFMLDLTSEDWDLDSATATSAVKLLIATVQALADFTGDVPPTPPISGPSTPSSFKVLDSQRSPPQSDPRFPLSPVSPVSPIAHNGHAIEAVSMPSPEAHRDEPISPAESATVQRAAISRRFFLKSVPPFSLSEYLMRIHHYCPHSPGVYLAAAAYVHRLCVSDMLVPATSKTIHRLCLAAIRVASKAFEDHKWSQDRVAKVGGVSRKELKSLEINLCFLLDFDLFLRVEDLKKRVFLLQQAARQGMTIKKRLSDGFRMRLPVREQG